MRKINCVNGKCQLESNAMAQIGGGRLSINGETYMPLPKSPRRSPKKVAKKTKQTGSGTSSPRVNSSPKKRGRKRKASPKKSTPKKASHKKSTPKRKTRKVNKRKK